MNSYWRLKLSFILILQKSGAKSSGSLRSIIYNPRKKHIRKGKVLLRGAKAEDLEEGLFLGGPGLLPPLPVELNNGTIVASLVQVSSALSRVRLVVTPWTAACQVSLSITNSRSLLKLMSVEPMMPSNHLILCHPLLLLPSMFPSIRVFSNELVLHIRWPKYWSFSFSISPSNEYSGLISFRMD